MASFENGKLSAVWFDQGPHAEGVASAERRKARVQLLMLMQKETAGDGDCCQPQSWRSMVGMTLCLLRVSSQEKKKVLLRVGSVSISVALWISRSIELRTVFPQRFCYMCWCCV